MSFTLGGGRQKPGLYSDLCRDSMVSYRCNPWRTFVVKAIPLPIYRDLLSKVGDSIKPEYDLILIDEAQDFPSEVFQVAFKLAKGTGAEKRIIWAYDEFQSLRDAEIGGRPICLEPQRTAPPIFPTRFSQENTQETFQRTFVLPNCYRTPRPVLMTAHGIAMG